MPLKLTYYPDPVLRQLAPPVQRIDQELRERVEEMFDIMYEHHGIGLAAPQVAWSTRLFVLNIEGDPEEGEELVYINPKIIASDGSETEEEGCLSLPEIRGKVRRPYRITVRAQDLEGEWFEEEVEDLHARAIQHEIDHLDGILFPQRMSLVDRMALKKALKNLAENPPE